MVRTPEEQESEKTASKKLELLESSDFKNFAVRFVNIGEYISIMEKGFLEPREIYVFEKSGSFQEFLKNSKPHEETYGRRSFYIENPWLKRIFDQAKWEESAECQQVYHNILHL